MAGLLLQGPALCFLILVIFSNFRRQSKSKYDSPAISKPAMKDEKENEQQINVELSEEMAEGVYSNLAMIAHSNSEFILDFIRLMPGVPRAKVKARIIVTPEHAKRLVAALKDNIQKYEDQYGPIQSSQDNEPTFNFPISFGGPGGEA